MRNVVLNFHGLGTPARATEPGEDAYWVAPTLLEAALQLAERYKDQIATTFTFDDGNASDVDLGAPLLDRFSRKGRFFVLADRIDTPGSLSRSDIRALADAGHIVGTHGAAHTDWRAMPDTSQKAEWYDARERISDAAGHLVTEAAIPFGSYNAKVLRGLQSAGYDCAWSSDGGTWHETAFLRPRTSPRVEMTEETLEDVLLGREPLLRRLRRPLAMAVKRRV